MTKRTTVALEDAKANAAALRKRWRAGQESLVWLGRIEKADPAALQYGRKDDTLRAEAQRLGTNIDSASKARRLAREYDGTQLDAVCAAVEKHCSRFSATHWLVLLRVDDRKRRDKLMQQAIRKSWTRSRLDRAVQAARGSRREHVGRKPRLPADPLERLLALDALCVKWARWTEAARPDMPARMQGLIDRATRAVNAVRQAVADELET